MGRSRAAQLRRIARLEVLADRRFQSEQRALGEQRKIKRDAGFVTIANVCLIALYGTPQIDEPLFEAWKRSCQKLLRKFPASAEVVVPTLSISPRLPLSPLIFASMSCLAYRVRTTTKKFIAYWQTRHNGWCGLRTQIEAAPTAALKYQMFPKCSVLLAAFVVSEFCRQAPSPCAPASPPPSRPARTDQRRGVPAYKLTTNFGDW
jgi:hypothetical protein